MCKMKTPTQAPTIAPTSPTPSPEPVAEVVQEDEAKRKARTSRQATGTNNLTIARDSSVGGTGGGSGLGIAG